METDGVFLTNRCSDCGRAMTKLEIIERMQSPSPLCPCGSNKFKSSNFKLWEELFLFRSWKQWMVMKLGLLPPAPNRHEVASNRDTMIKEVSELEDDTCLDQDEGFVRDDGFAR